MRPTKPCRGGLGVPIGLNAMKKSYRASFLRRGRRWVAWTEDVPGALTQGKTLSEAKSNLRDAIRLMLEPASLEDLPKSEIVRERIRA